MLWCQYGASCGFERVDRAALCLVGVIRGERAAREIAGRGLAVVAVLHDLNHAFRYADQLIAMRDGVVLATGAPEAIATSDLVREVFGIDCRILADPITTAPMVVPHSQRSRTIAD